MNFFPLCTAMVCPIISGTMVERRDQVFTTFFSFRAFRASTFSRRWPSTNGPFLSERAIDLLFLHAAQASPLRVPQLLETAHRPGNAVRPGTERANEPRALSIGDALDDHRPARLAQLVQDRLRRRHVSLGRGNGRLCRRSLRPLAGPGAVLRPQGRPPRCCPTCPCRSHGFCSQPAAFNSLRASRLNWIRPCKTRGNPVYLRRSTINLSVRLFRRVFFPKVGKAHGVCG